MKRHHAQQYESPGAELVFNLAGELGIDPDRAKAERDAAERAQEEARAIEAKRQCAFPFPQ